MRGCANCPGRLAGMAAVLRCLVALLLWSGLSAFAHAAEPARPDIRTTGAPAVLFDPARDGCDGNDVPDAPARLFRNAAGAIVLFGLHYTNHALVGPSLEALKIVCYPALPSHGNADPAAYDDKSWMAATWTRDGRVVDGLVHHEYQADSHPGRCRFPLYMQCWFNTVLSVRSGDGGASFAKAAHPVVASAPFPQDVDQGRHRGFFNPSNIVSDGRFFYALIATTGWDGQDGGVCLFRTDDPDKPETWRAFDGTAFTVQYADPYRAAADRRTRSCMTLAPFPAPVGSVVRQRDTGVWLAVFQAQRDQGRFPVSGFYAATSRDLVHWSEPRLLLAGTTNYEDPCGSGGRLIAYPSLVDPAATGRNFDDVGTTAQLLYARLKVEGCTITSDRVLVRQAVTIAGP